MIHQIFSVRDSAMDAFMRPFTLPTAGTAIRSFTDEVNRAAPDNEMNRHPTDYTLYELGQFDDQSGLVTPHPAPKQILRAADALYTQPSPPATPS